MKVVTPTRPVVDSVAQASSQSLSQASSQSASQSTFSHQSALIRMASAAWMSRSVYVAAKLRIADFLKADAKSYAELATLTETEPQALYRLLRALASVGLFSETEPGLFMLTQTGYFLRSDISESLHALTIMYGEDDYKAAGCLLHSLKTGESAFEKLYDMPVFDYFQQNPDAAKTFDAAMTSYSSVAIPAILEAYDFSDINVLVDVAGGVGSLLGAVLKQNSHMKGILYEVPPVIEKAQAMVKSSEVADRMQLVAGSFFESVPFGGDACLLKHIIHDWSDEQSLTILGECRKALPADGKLLLIEHVILPGDEPCFGKLFDIGMLLWCKGGKERTESEYRDLLAQAGFQMSKVIQTGTPLIVIEAVPV
ncbi:MAG: methyltransferase [Cyanobacteria bacterium J06650_10]